MSMAMASSAAAAKWRQRAGMAHIVGYADARPDLVRTRAANPVLKVPAHLGPDVAVVPQRSRITL